jgi:hypothetical protein
VGRALLLVLPRRGVMRALVRFPWLPQRVGLAYMADQLAWPPLALRVMPGNRGSEPSVTHGMSRMILGMVHEQSSPHILGSISSRVPSTRSFTRPFHSL